MIASVFGIEVQIEVDQKFGIDRSVFGIEFYIELGQFLGSKLTGFEIEVGLTGIETNRFVFQLVVDQCCN